MSFLSSPSQLRLALIILNVEHRCQMASDLFTHLWDEAAVRVCADGAANRLHDTTPPECRASMLPDVITGDLDSLRDEVAQFYERHGVSVVREPEQDSHDFEKCLRWLQRQHDTPTHETARGTAAEDASVRSAFSVAAYGAFGGRLDQQMANLNMLYRSEYTCFDNFLLLSEDSLSLLLRPGTHTIEPNLEVEDGTCGLVPLGGRCDNVVTHGLKWDLDGTVPLEFGALISSSNQVVAPTVTVRTEQPLLWTTSLLKVRQER